MRGKSEEFVFDQEEYINENNPRISNGYELIFCKEINLSVIYENENTEKMLILIHIYSKQTESEKEFLVEFFNDEDIKFMFSSVINPSVFRSLGLKIAFEEFGASLIQLLEQTMTESNLVVSFKVSGENAELVFSQKLKLRVAELFSLNFQSATQQDIVEFTQYRYKLFLLEVINMNESLSKILSKIDAKNPSLGDHLRKHMKNYSK